MPEPNAEQTTSWWGFLFFGYLTPVIRMASRVKHLEVNQMPPLMDTDASKNLIAYAFPVSELDKDPSSYMLTDAPSAPRPVQGRKKETYLLWAYACVS